ncbi:TlpA family protein disulfide reductase [Streptomyces sp. NPDC058001]|uniref:TlpA family protein disulfide reductase n=1 Tax=Streptomyces sp. NPDC058001 TaxID=3346300 RepID=UPI0036E7EDA4
MSAARRTPQSRHTRSGRAVLLSAGAVTAALALTACASGGTSGGSGNTNYITGSDGVATVKKADRKSGPQLDGETLEGKQLDVTDLKGKIVVLNIWGSWCPPCRAEAPGFAKVSKESKAQGVEFVGINTRDTDRAPAKEFEKNFGVTYPSLYDPMGKLMLRFPKGTLNPQSIPSTVVLDRDGKIAVRSLTALSEEKLRSILKPLIAEK